MIEAIKTVLPILIFLALVLAFGIALSYWEEHREVKRIRQEYEEQFGEPMPKTYKGYRG